MKSAIRVFFLLLMSVAVASAGESPIVGKLGKAVGTAMTIEGTFQDGKNSWLLVSTVNDKKLATPVLMPTENLDPFAHIPTNTVCRFQGKEITYVVEAVIDPKTGREMQQASSGRHFDFKVTKVLAPGGVKTRDEK
ncbi:MAG: hypothetical protein JWM68_290 [Verrucomicrobiales bacterium]|nr:hypothetical protein [Verrucomicrobiales bacterium]